MRLRFSLRMLLVCTVAVAAAAAFIALRTQPARVAEQFQAAIQRGDRDSAVTMIVGTSIQQALDAEEAASWKIETVEFSPQTFSQWLQGKCIGQLEATAHHRSENAEEIVSAIETVRCDVAATTKNVMILKLTKDDPMVAIIPQPPYETDGPDQSADE